MNYVNDRFCELMQSVRENRELIETMKQDVDAFMPEFHDSPDRISRWGHYYFCDEDGGRLIFDLNSPREHRCQVCGKVYKNEILDGVWVYFYRNRAVVMGLVSAVIYKATGEKKYLDYAVKVIDFYAEHYREFVLHNKENAVCESYDSMAWGCGRMMPQGLNESIVAIRFVQTLEIIRDAVAESWLEKIHKKLFREMFCLLAPQATSIHNISCWNLSAIGVMGLAFRDQEMIRFAFESEYNIREQLRRGVTEDFFWYEGSIHYNFFLLEGISYLFLFSKIYQYDFGQESSRIFENMFIQAYHYAFDNQYLPNPNDGWPNLNLRTFSYIYHTVARAFGEDSRVGNLIKLIEADPKERTSLPLSEPYYCRNRVCLEQLLFNLDFDYKTFRPEPRTSRNFPRSNFVILRNGTWNAFMKYGLNGKSHAHPDIMNIELMCGGRRVSRDLSNAGYRSRLCNEWHRKTLSHNTVCFNGEDMVSVHPGECLYYDGKKVTARAVNVYEGVDYCRTIEIGTNWFEDAFQVSGSREGIYDYTFHFEPDFVLECDWDAQEGELGFKRNGYEHILEIKKVKKRGEQALIYAQADGQRLKATVDLSGGKELYLLKTMDNPVTRIRTTLLVRGTGTEPYYHLRLELEKEPV